MTKFKSFTAASRRPNMIPFGMFPQGRDLSWIQANVEVPDILTPTGTINGVNGTFTLDENYTSVWLFLDGVLLKSGTDYTWTAATRTVLFTSAVPATGSLLQAIGGWVQP